MDFIDIMFTNPLLHWTILTGGTVLFFILGWLWYSPVTPIGKIWGSYFPAPATMPGASQVIIMLLVQLLMGFIVTHTVVALWLFATGVGLSGVLATLLVVKVFMGFVFIKDIGHSYFEGRPIPLLFISVGYYLVGVLGVCMLLQYGV